MKAFTVTVLTKPSCVQCTQTIRHLTNRGVPFVTQPIEDPRKVADETGFASAPIVLVPEHNIAFSGYRPDRLDQLKELFNEEQAS